MNELFWLVMFAVLISLLRSGESNVRNIYPKPSKSVDSGPGLSSYPPVD